MTAVSSEQVPATMRAALLLGVGGPEMLEIRDDVPVPTPADGEALVRVSACGMNNTDINTRVGWYGGPAGWGGGLQFPRVQGADPCGRVVDIGLGVDPTLVGHRVIADPWTRGADPYDRADVAYLGSERDGGFAEFCVIPASNLYVVDSPYSDVELASFACSYSTAEHMLTRVGLRAGQSIAITGASGGVGSALVQLAYGRGADVVAVTSRAKAELVRDLGAAAVVTREDGDVVAAALRVSGGRLDAVADVVGGPDVGAWLGALTRGGGYVTSGAIAGAMVEVDLRTVYLNDLELHGATVFPPEVFATLVQRIRSGQVRPVISQTFPLASIREAQEVFELKQHLGALVLTI
jgi:NADPH:quinone reductase-like Zn-dependent oxidoreductase